MTPSSLSHLRQEQDACLRDHTSFRLGGPCTRLIHCKEESELIRTVQSLTREKEPFMVIGGGTNLVFSDRGLSCPVIRYVTDRAGIEVRSTTLTVPAGAILDDVVSLCAGRGLSGINYASGIPGTVAGAVIGNAGAFGRQIGDSLISVDIITPDGHLRTLTRNDITFSYRHSSLKDTGIILTSVRLAVGRADREGLLKEREDILILRRQKHPDVSCVPCAGSVFRNVEPTSKAGRRQAAGWFLEQAGAKGLRVGGAAVFERHANIIIKAAEDCTAADVHELSRQMADCVEKKFGLRLVPEIRFIGEFD